jgi:hypothetical protein
MDLREVPASAAGEIHSELPAVLEGLGSFEDSVERRISAGGTSRESVLEQLGALECEFARSADLDPGAG